MRSPLEVAKKAVLSNACTQTTRYNLVSMCVRVYMRLHVRYTHYLALSKVSISYIPEVIALGTVTFLA